MKCILLISLLFTNTLQAQIKNLVFEGAGIRGIAYCGAIKKLEEKGVLQYVSRVGGTSAGAITALALSLGYNADELAELINSTSFKKFNDGNLFFFGGLHRLRNYYGWYKSKKFEKWLSDIIKNKTKNADITFSELHNKGYKDLFVTGTSLDQQKLFVFSYEQFPQMKVRDAVRISMSIPLYFEAVFMNKNGLITRHQKNKQGLHVMIDGGLIANFPIRLFDSTKYVDPEKPNTFTYNSQTIGVRIDRELQINNDSTTRLLAPFEIKGFKSYLNAFYTMVIESLNRQMLTVNDWKRTISISDAGIGPRIRKISLSDKRALIGNGEVATSTFLRSITEQQ